MVREASGVAAGGGSSGGLGDAMRRMPNGRKGRLRLLGPCFKTGRIEPYAAVTKLS